TGKDFSKGVVPTRTPSSSTLAPGGLLVILRDSAEAEATKQRSREAMTNKRRRRGWGIGGSLRGVYHGTRQRKVICEGKGRNTERTAATTRALYSGGRLLLIAGTAQDGEGRIFRETRIGLRKLAQQELRTLCGFHGARVRAVGTQSEGVRVRQRRHREKIPQGKALWGAAR